MGFQEKTHQHRHSTFSENLPTEPVEAFQNPREAPRPVKATLLSDSYGLQHSLPPKRIRHYLPPMIPLCLVNLMCALDASMLAVMLPQISHDLGGSATQTFWTATSYLLTAAVSQPLWSLTHEEPGLASLALPFALFLFGLGGQLAVMATSSDVLLGARCVQGLGAGGLIVLTYIIVPDITPEERQPACFGLVALQWALGGSIGPVVGGAVAGTSDWRLMLSINLIVCMCAYVTMALIPPALTSTEDTMATARTMQCWGKVIGILRKADWIGTGILIPSLVSFIVAVTLGGSVYPWTSPNVLAPLVPGFLGLASFVLYGTFFTEKAILPRSMFVGATAKTAWLAAFAHGFTSYCLLFYLPLYFSVVKGFQPVVTGAALLTFSLPTGIAAMIVSRLVSRPDGEAWRKYLFPGWCITALAAVLMTLVLNVGTSHAAWVLICILGGAGLGISWSSTLNMASNMKRKHIGDSGLGEKCEKWTGESARQTKQSSAAFSFFRSIGQAMGVAGGGSLFQNALAGTLGEGDASPSVADVLRDAGANGADRAVSIAVSDAQRVLWVMIIIVSVVVAFLVAMIGMPKKPPPEADEEPFDSLKHYSFKYEA